MNSEILLISGLLISLYYQYTQNTKINDLQKKAFGESIEIEKQVHNDDNKINNDNDDNLLLSPELQEERNLLLKRDTTIADEIEHRKELQERDYKVVYDPLTAGEKRVPSHLYPRTKFKNTINIPTQGLPDNYQYMGNLVRQSDNKILPIFGRQEYPGSDNYEYYSMINQNSDFGIKIPLNNGKRMRELQEDAEIHIDYFNKDDGGFIYKPFQNNTPRYNPFIY